MAFQLRIPNTEKIGEGFMLGLGILGAYVAYRTAMKYLEQFSGGMVPDEFIVAQASVDDGYTTEY